MSRVVLTLRQREQLLKALGFFAPPITRVDVYGSRARGDALPGSDVDLILAGDLDADTISRVRRALADSYLSIFADVTAYALIQPGPFADEVARDAATLFTAEELAAAPAFAPVSGFLDWYRPRAASATELAPTTADHHTG